MDPPGDLLQLLLPEPGQRAGGDGGLDDHGALLRRAHGHPGPAGRFRWANFLLFPTVAGSIGMFLGAAEGIMCRNMERGAPLRDGRPGDRPARGDGRPSSSRGSSSSSRSCWPLRSSNQQLGGDDGPRGLALLIIMMGRASAWAVASIPAGIGQGIALRESKVIVNGLLGGVLGGLVGGILFDPINSVFVGEPTARPGWAGASASPSSACSSACSSGSSSSGPSRPGC